MSRFTLRNILSTSRPSLSCEHYSWSGNKDHLHDTSVGDGSYNIDYIEAVLCEDQEEIDRIEQAASSLGYEPLIECTTITNNSAQRTFCREFIFTAGCSWLTESFSL